MPQTPRLSLRGISKRFENTVALSGVDMDVAPGEVVGLIGENGAGKSTLAKIIAGIHQPNAGEIRVEGELRVIDSVRTAQSLGIAVVHQELNLVPHLDVESNVLLGREPFRLPVVRLNDNRALRAQAGKALDTVGLRVPPGTLVMDLSIAEQQRVEIAKALSLNARVLIMDEPTSSLSISEAEALLEIIEALRERGISVIYISHKLDEVRRVSDRIVVFRDGRKVAETSAAEATPDGLITAMVGRELSAMFPKREATHGETVLAVRGLVASGLNAPVSVELRSGELLGVAGLVGSGRSELLRGIFGASKRGAGTVRVPSVGGVGGSPSAAMRAGIGFVPEDRKTQGLLLRMSVRDNVALAILRKLAHFAFRRRRAEAEVADRFVQRLNIVVSSPEQPVLSLSGGNQQKCLLAKWLAIEPRVLLLDEPTRGIDVGAKHEVYRLIAQIAASGVGVMMVSSEMEEIIGMCDRTLVMNEGTLAGELGRDEMSEENIMALAAHTGINAQTDSLENTD